MGHHGRGDVPDDGAGLLPRGQRPRRVLARSPDKGTWSSERPGIPERRVPGLVHEGSALAIGETDEFAVGLDYRLRGTENVYVTGGCLWPTGGSWNPTMTMAALAQDLADRLALVGAETAEYAASGSA